MKKIIIIIILIGLVGLLTAQNPFSKPQKNDSRKQVSQSAISQNIVWQKIVEVQKKLNRSLSQSLRKLKDDFDYKVLLILLGISFLYGVVHALGPGHGKMLVSAYFIQEKGSVFSSLKIGSIISITHSGSAAILGLIVGIFFRSAKIYKDDIQVYIAILSGSLIAILGLVYLGITLFKKESAHEALHGKNEILLGIFSGIVPCPVSLTIILFSIYLDLIWLGFLCVIALSMGMAVTISLIGILIIKTRAITDLMTKKRSKLGLVLGKVLAISGSLLIVFIGLSMIFSNL